MSEQLPVHISVFNERGELHGAEDGIAAATVTPEYPNCQCGPLLDTHRLQTVLPEGVPYGVPGIIHIEVPGYQTIHQEVILQQDIGVQLVPLAPPLTRLQPAGPFFTAAGARFTAIEASDFLLYQHYLDGQNIEPVLTQRRDAGFNMLRIFGSCNGSLGRFIPMDYGDAYFARLTAFYDLLTRYRLYGEFTAIVDAQAVYHSAEEQNAVWMRLGTVFPSIPNALVEAVNEADQPINRLWADPVRMLNVLVSHGSNGSQAWPVMPHWSYATFHTNGAPEWWRKTGHNAMEIWEGPTLTNENTRYPDNDSSQAHAYDAAAGAALLCAGSCFHSVHGKSSQLWEAAELDAAIQWASGAKAVPLLCQPGLYRHRIDLEGPSDLRVYQRGVDDRCIVHIRK